jgi:anion-transporting  ArsA/GET3 family ATPase
MKNLRKEIDDKLKELELADELDEMSVTGNLDGGEGPPKTPFAFQGKSKKGKKKRMKAATNSTGYAVVKDLDESNSTYKQMMSILHLKEVTYKEYKSDPEFTSKQKVNRAISEVAKKLYEIEKIVNRNIKLKTESGVKSNQYWKSSRTKLYKISERMIRISNNLKRLSS